MTWYITFSILLLAVPLAFYVRLWLQDRLRDPPSVTARLVRYQRRRFGLSPARAAAIAGVPVSRLRAIESGEVRADREAWLIEWDLRRWADDKAAEGMVQ